jgi:hypothetical protein
MVLARAQKPDRPAVSQVYPQPTGPGMGMFFQVHPVVPMLTENGRTAMFVYAAPIGPRKPTTHEIVRRIKAEVARAYNVTVMDLESARRDIAAVRARHCAVWRIKRETPWSTTRIGRAFGGRDHSSIIHGIRRHQARIDAGEVMP